MSKKDKKKFVKKKWISQAYWYFSLVSFCCWLFVESWWHEVSHSTPLVFHYWYGMHIGMSNAQDFWAAHLLSMVNTHHTHHYKTCSTFSSVHNTNYDCFLFVFRLTSNMKGGTNRVVPPCKTNIFQSTLLPIPTVQLSYAHSIHILIGYETYWLVPS